MSYLFIENRRKSKKITQEQAAKMLGISETKSYRRRLKQAIEDIYKLSDQLDFTILMLPNEYLDILGIGSGRTAPAAPQPIVQPDQPKLTGWRANIGKAGQAQAKT